MAIQNTAKTQVQQEESTALQAEIDRLTAEVEALRAARAKGGRLSLKASAKGAVSVYGLGRFPVTLYQEQWVRLLSAKDEILTFVKDNAAVLSTKPVA